MSEQISSTIRNESEGVDWNATEKGRVEYGLPIAESSK
jgi:hypothetical protein